MGKLFIYVQRSSSYKLRLLGWKVPELWIIRKKARYPRLASSTCQSARMTRRGDESDVIFCFSCSMRHAITERIFLIIYSSRFFHPNNLKFWETLLCTYMNNFPTRSFLSVKLSQTLFVGKVRKTQTIARINLLLNIYKQSTIQFFKGSYWLKWYFLRMF